MRYSIEILWSKEDDGYIATVPELGPGCSGFGKTEEDALMNVKTAKQLYMDALKQDSIPLPKPRYLQ